MKKICWCKKVANKIVKYLVFDKVLGLEFGNSSDMPLLF